LYKFELFIVSIFSPVSQFWFHFRRVFAYFRYFWDFRQIKMRLWIWPECRHKLAKYKTRPQCLRPRLRRLYSRGHELRSLKKNCEITEAKNSNARRFLKISEIEARFWRKFRVLTKTSIFDQNFNFWAILRFLPKFRLVTKISIFYQNFESNFGKKSKFSSKSSIVDQNFDF